MFVQQQMSEVSLGRRQMRFNRKRFVEGQLGLYQLSLLRSCDAHQRPAIRTLWMPLQIRLESMACFCGLAALDKATRELERIRRLRHRS
jgi:hypothetical protein